MGDQATRDALARSIAARVHALKDAGDELRVLDQLLVRLELGRDRYGALDLNRARDWEREVVEEMLDMRIYQAIAKLTERDGSGA